jgi:sugar phosphate isomerase/epimerase
MPSVDTESTPKIGVQTYSFRNIFPKNLIETLDKVSELGIEEVELFQGRIPPEEMKRLCDERGLKIPSIMVDFDVLDKNPKKAVELAKMLGCQYISCAWIPHQVGDFNLKNTQRAIEVFNEAGKIIADAGLKFTYHPHGYEFRKQGDGILLDLIFEKTNPDYVFFEMDTYWIHFGGGDPVEWLEKHPNRWKLMHLKDIQKGTPTNLTGQSDVNTNVPLGEGELDFQNILKTAKRVGVEHFFIEDESDRVMEQLPKSVAFLKRLGF